MKELTVNGHAETVDFDEETLLVDVLRDQLQLTGTKLVCGAGVCGACTVLIDDVPMVSCLLPAKAAQGKSVTTVEGIGGQDLHPIQRAFMAFDALQCGFCTPGFIVDAVAFHDRWRKANGTIEPSRDEIGTVLSGHLCRCGAYDNIFRAVAEACKGKFDSPSERSPRIEAHAKVTGTAKYTVDIVHDGQLEGLILRSKIAHARLTRTDIQPALAMEGVRAGVILLEAGETIRHVGQAIAAIAAENRTIAHAALSAIEIDSETLPGAVGVRAARRDDAPEVFPGRKTGVVNASEGPMAPARWKGNIRGPTAAFSSRKGKAQKWIKQAREAGNRLLFEETFVTAVQQHTSLEPHAAVARFDGDRLVVHVSTQAIYELKGKIVKRFGLEPKNVEVVADHIGGGFGSKAVLGEETEIAIRLAKESGAPVRVAFDRSEELSVAGYRPGASMNISLLPGEDGTLKALSLEAHSDAGIAVNSTIAGLARLIYPAEAKYLADFDIVSNLPPGSPFRGPGGPPMAFALEQAIDEVAKRLEIGPIELRKRWDNNPNRARLYDWAGSLDCWREGRATTDDSGRFRRGVGVAAGYWLYLWQIGTKIELAVENHRLVVKCSVQDIGTGTRSVLAETVARAFDLERDEVEVRIGNSELPPGPGSGGSRVTASVVPPTLLAAEKLKKSLLENHPGEPKPGSNAPWRELIAAASDVAVTADRPEDDRQNIYGNSSLFKEAGIVGTVFGWMMRRFSHLAVGAGAPSSVQVVEVEVDTLLGHVTVEAVHTGIAVGRLAAPELARSQAIGAIVQGVGYALYENREVDLNSGYVLTAGLDDYRIPGIADTPAMDIHFDEGGFEHVLGGSVGIGEVATVPTAAAIANAVCDAIKVRPTEIPIRPDRILALLGERKVA